MPVAYCLDHCGFKVFKIRTCESFNLVHLIVIKDFLLILDPLGFQMNFRISMSILTKMSGTILIEISLIYRSVTEVKAL